MASGEITSCLAAQIQKAMCQLRGKDMKSGGHRNEAEANYQKQVDPPRAPHTQIIPDFRYDEQEKAEKKNVRGKPASLQIFLPLPLCKDSTEKKAAKPKKEPRKGIVSSASMKASCLPTGGSQCPQPVKMMLWLPCPPPNSTAGGTAAPGGETNCGKSKKPRDYTYRCESRELRGGNLYTCCQCNKRNGLQHDCPRTPCQGRPACLVKPWPDCWPSGGRHGVDYTREIGVKRYDPCRERFDKKECRGPAGSSQPKSECGGNMAVVVAMPQ